MHKIIMKPIGRFKDGRIVYTIDSSEPLLGLLPIGVIDRGTNVLQVRPTTICPLNCIFCSVDAGPFSRHRWAEYIVSPRTIIDTVELVARHKGVGLEALIDTVGDPLTYPYLPKLVRELKKIPQISSVAIETHGALLTKKIIDKLDDAGLDRINLSIDTLNEDKARFLQGVKWFNVRKVMELAEYLVKNTSIDLHVTPVWIPGINDDDVIEVVKWALKIGAGKKWPPVTIQKYNVHKFGRRIPNVKPMGWQEFWRKLEDLEKKLGIRLRWGMDEWGMRYMPRVPNPMKKNDIVVATIIGRGWLKGEYLGYVPGKKRFLTIVNFRHKLDMENRVNVYVKIIDDKDGIFIGGFIGFV